MKKIMEATIRNKKGKSTLIIKGDFYQILDENFKEICKAIANKGIILKELKGLCDTNGQAFINDIIRIIHSSYSPAHAVVNLHEEMGISMMASQYIMNLPLTMVASLNSKGMEKELNKYQKQIAVICSSMK